MGVIVPKKKRANKPIIKGFELKFLAKARGNHAVGDLFIYHEGNLLKYFNANSGKWGRGFLPNGKYIAKYWRQEAGEPFSISGYGFFVYIEPQFKTDRTELGIHMDGNVPGSRGCIALNAYSEIDARDTYNYIKQIFREQNEVPLVVNIT